MKLSQLALTAPLALIPALALLQPILSSEKKSLGKSQAAPSPVVSSHNKEASGLEVSSHATSERSEDNPQSSSQLSPLTLIQLSPEQRAQVTAYLEALQSTPPNQRPWMCFSPDTSPALLAAYHEAEVLAGMHRSPASGADGPQKANQFLNAARWGQTATDGNTGLQGNNVTLTWSIVPDGAQVSTGLTGSRETPSDFRNFLTLLYGGNFRGKAEDQPWFPIFQAAFDDLGDEAGITFVYEPNDDGSRMAEINAGRLGQRGDIRLGGSLIDGDSGVLAFAYSPNFGDIVFDTEDDFYQNTDNDSLGLHNIITHEVGHAIGLAHVCPVDNTKLMEPFINFAFRGPQFDERFALHRQYGDPFETKDGGTSNDTLGQATAIELNPDGTFTENNLSIDDNSDTDFFKFVSPGNQTINVRIDPALFNGASYLEGPQTIEGCTPGTNFSPNDIHNLSLELLGPDSINSIALVDNTSAGSSESLSNITLSEAGTYYLKVTGSPANNAQRYSLIINSGTAPEETIVAMTGMTVVEESGTERNNRPDPEETIKLSVELTNSGAVPADQLTATLVSVDGAIIFQETASYGNLGLGNPQAREFLVGINRDCGQQVSLNLTVQDNNSYQASFPLTFELGGLGPNTLGSTNFDLSSDIPDQWTTTSSTNSPQWSISGFQAQSAPNLIFGTGSSAAVNTSLVSPSLPVSPGPGNISFTHKYGFEFRWDGGVLEYSLNEGEWLDLLSAPGVEVLEGGYARDPMNNFTSTPLVNRNAWTGESVDFITTRLNLPENWAEGTVRFRWFMAHDTQTGGLGWLIDDISITTSASGCNDHVPALNLAVTDEELTEGPEGTTVTVSTPLPLTQDFPFSIITSGSVDTDDFELPLTGTLPSGETSVTLNLVAPNDNLTEDPETLELAFDLSSGLFATEDNSPINITISDGTVMPTGFSTWADTFSVTDPAADDDGDGQSNLAEYLLDSDPTIFSPPFTVRLLPTSFDLVTGPLPERPDATLGVESSSNLEKWDPVPSITPIADGLQVARDGDALYYRLTFSLTSDE